MKAVKVHDRTFEIRFTREQIVAKVNEMGEWISRDFEGECPVFLVILNGAFIFASDLIRAVKTDSEIQFLRIQSYVGTQSTGVVNQAVQDLSALNNRHVIIVEDIIETGLSLDHVLKTVGECSPKSVKVATFLFKPHVSEVAPQIDYVGFEIGREFIVGYGMDYNGLGRNLPHIYQELT